MTLVIIPARLASARMQGKMLELIGRKTVLQHCIDRAHEAGFAPWVATDSNEIVDSIAGKCPHIFTGAANCGTDRVAMAAELIDPACVHQYVVNFQGDMPFIDPMGLRAVVAATENGSADVTTATCLQAVVECNPPNFMRAKVPLHIGLYGYKRDALRRFHALPQSPYELQYSLEQLRAPHQFTWQVVEFHWMPIEINKKIDLEEVRRCRL